MYTMLPLTQVLRAGVKKENPGKRSDRDALFASQKTGAGMGDGERGGAGCWDLHCNLNE